MLLPQIAQDLHDLTGLTVRYGTESLTHLANKIWSIIPTEAKNAPTLESFKQQIKLWQTTNCPCGICKTYIQQIGFISS